jgi:HlyD family secretion protein
VTLSLPPGAPALLVPNASVQRVGGRDGVWRIEAERPVFAPVRVGERSLDGQAQVLDGLRTGDRIVVYSQKALAPGARVQVVDALVPSTAAGSPP